MKSLRRNALVVATWLITIALGQVICTRAQSYTTRTGERKAELVVQTGHTWNLRSVTFSPDGRYLASGGNDSTIKLWEIESGRELKTFAGHKGDVSSIAFSPDGSMIASAGYDGTLKLWDITSGKMLATTPDPVGYVTAMDSVAFSHDGSSVAVSQLDPPESKITVYESRTLRQMYSVVGGSTLWAQIAFSPDGRILAGSENQETVKLWNAKTGAEIRTMTGKVYDRFKHNTADITFSADGKTIVSGGSDGVARLWDVATGAELKAFQGHTNRVSAVALSSDGKRLITASWDKTIRFWDVESGREYQPPKKTVEYISDTALMRNGSLLAIAEGKDIRVWDLDRGGEPTTLTGNVFLTEGIALSPDNAYLAVGEYGDRLGLWNLRSQTRLTILPGHKGNVRKLEFSPNGKILATGGGFVDGKIKLWNSENGTEINVLTGHENSIYALAFSPDGRMLASGGHDEITRLWDVASGRLIKEFKDTSRENLANEVRALAFTADGKSIIRSALAGIVMWNIETGAVEKNLIGMGDTLDALAISDDGTHLVGRGFYNKRLLSWDLKTGALLHDLPNNFANRETLRKLVPQIKFDDEVASSKFVFRVEENRKVKMFDRFSNSEVASIVGFYGESWAIVAPDGLFDASPEARKRLHYVIGLEAVTLDQMKDVYYVPGLLHKLLTGEPLPKIELFSAKDLFPDVEFAPPAPGDTVLPIRITDRGGGIGQVQVLINGKEFVRDARPVNFDPASKRLDLRISLKDAPVVAEGENSIEVVARNAAGSLTTRGTARASEKFVSGHAAAKPDPHIYIIAGGISRYAAENLTLNFAAKDAEDFSKALEIGAAKLLKDKTKVHVRLLTSSPTTRQFTVPDAKNYGATKADFERAFADFKGATANDVFVVYLAGHGISVGEGGAAGNTYLYLTQEATTTDRSILSVESSRRAMAVSSEELKEMMKQNKALKQALILDTCAAGAASGSFVAKRDVPPDQIAALERLKDNTGFYILMGSAADAVSYEASQYGQGLLTYSLLQGMKGARLRDDQFADVELLFGYAKDTVGVLAKNVGGMQQPRTITPDVSRSFDIGQFTPTEREQITTLANPVPLILRPRLTNPKLRYDNLGLEKLLRAALRRASLVATGVRPKLMLVESDEMADAYLPSGDYSVEGDTITINLVLVLNQQAVREITVSGKLGDKEALIENLVERIASGR